MPNLYKTIRSKLLYALTGAPYTFSYAADGFAVKHKHIPFHDNPRFDAAWREVVAINQPFWPDGFPDIRWRAHTCLWAAEHCLRLPGDFAEFGVNTAILSSMLLRLLPIDQSGKTFYLFDTFSGIPDGSVSKSEAANSSKLNDRLYTQDVYEFTKSHLSPFPSARLVRGLLPDSLAPTSIDALSYVSIDLNSAPTEIAVAEAIWDRIVEGGMIVLDDYGFGGHEVQTAAWNSFMRKKERTILALPTGQGVIVK